jgi:uncharacterized membrane protein
MRSHFTQCFLAGLVAILPVGGLIFLVYKLETEIKPLAGQLPFYFPGMGILAAVVVIYLLGLTVTTFIGRWLWDLADRLLSRLPGLKILYGTLKQILGYGAGKDALFRSVVLVPDSATGTLELGLVTEEVKLEGRGARWAVFLPGSPNPAMGRMVLIEAEKCIATKIPVDVALKALLSTGKTGL